MLYEDVFNLLNRELTFNTIDHLMKFVDNWYTLDFRSEYSIIGVDTICKLNYDELTNYPTIIKLIVDSFHPITQMCFDLKIGHFNNLIDKINNEEIPEQITIKILSNLSQLKQHEGQNQLLKALYNNKNTLSEKIKSYLKTISFNVLDDEFMFHLGLILEQRTIMDGLYGIRLLFNFEEVEETLLSLYESYELDGLEYWFYCSVHEGQNPTHPKHMKGKTMGRDTSITIVNRTEYDKVQMLKDILLEDDISNKFRFEIEKYIERKEREYVIREVAYWDKWDCDEIVEIMRKYNQDDGDIIMDENMLLDICHLISSENCALLDRRMQKQNVYVVYNTNG